MSVTLRREGGALSTWDHPFYESDPEKGQSHGLSLGYDCTDPDVYDQCICSAEGPRSSRVLVTICASSATSCKSTVSNLSLLRAL